MKNETLPGGTLPWRHSDWSEPRQPRGKPGFQTSQNKVSASYRAPMVHNRPAAREIWDHHRHRAPHIMSILVNILCMIVSTSSHTYVIGKKTVIIRVMFSFWHSNKTFCVNSMSSAGYGRVYPFSRPGRHSGRCSVHTLCLNEYTRTASTRGAYLDSDAVTATSPSP